MHYRYRDFLALSLSAVEFVTAFAQDTGGVSEFDSVLAPLALPFALLSVFNLCWSSILLAVIRDDDVSAKKFIYKYNEKIKRIVSTALF